MSEEKNKKHGGVGEDNPDAPKRVARKVRFQPKVPARKLPKPAVPKIDVPSEAELEEKMRFVNKNLGLGRKPKTEKKSEDMESDLTKKPTSTTIRSFGVRSCTSESSEMKSLDIVPFEENQTIQGTLASIVTIQLPFLLRRPYAGDPKIHNKEYDETEINAAAELCLMEESNETNMIFLQLPPSLDASIEVRYPSVLFKQQLAACVEKIFGMIRDLSKKKIGPLLKLCNQAPKAVRGNAVKSSKSPGSGSKKSPNNN
ncbi:hypothetical protein MKW98_006818 [Papaver atlanticum]|uniref:Uncharacterized protein n=1 Tax=Papaver atlanticum TaxID=357466 RepID=A0AAD4SVW1_9MAGN|nr:hypothetical protein MKW98_006818 [Papaver atlanticum]